jgi:hypothetical protein
MKKFVIFLPLFALSAYGQGHKAHVHGHSKAEITFEVDKLDIGLDIPGESLVGFENKPSDAKQEMAVNEAKKVLKDAMQVVKLNGGNCMITSQEVKLDYDLQN